MPISVSFVATAIKDHIHIKISKAKSSALIAKARVGDDK